MKILSVVRSNRAALARLPRLLFNASRSRSFSYARIASDSERFITDYYETLFYLDAGAEDLAADLASWVEADAILVHQAKGVRLLECKSQHPLPPDLLARAQAAYDLHAVRHLDPVLPVLSRRGMQVPYLTCEEMLAYDAGRGLPLWELAVHYEAARGNLTPDQVVERMRELVEIMRDSIQRGVAGTAYADRILGCQSRAFQERLTAGQLLDAGILNRMILYVTAIMECKSAMGTIATAGIGYHGSNILSASS